MKPILTGNFMTLPHSPAFELNIKISALSHSLNDEVVNKLTIQGLKLKLEHGSYS